MDITAPLEGRPDISYPCLWQYKIIGTNSDDLVAAITTICAPVPVQINPSHNSSGGRYCSLSAEIEVQNEEARLALYRAFQQHPDIKVVL